MGGGGGGGGWNKIKRYRAILTQTDLTNRDGDEYIGGECLGCEHESKNV